jgi:hypothetical protein
LFDSSAHTEYRIVIRTTLPFSSKKAFSNLRDRNSQLPTKLNRFLKGNPFVASANLHEERKQVNEGNRAILVQDNPIHYRKR